MARSRIIKTLSSQGTAYTCGVMQWTGRGSASAAYAYHSKLTMIVKDLRKLNKRFK